MLTLRRGSTGIRQIVERIHQLALAGFETIGIVAVDQAVVVVILFVVANLARFRAVAGGGG